MVCFPKSWGLHFPRTNILQVVGSQIFLLPWWNGIQSSSLWTNKLKSEYNNFANEDNCRGASMILQWMYAVFPCSCRNHLPSSSVRKGLKYNSTSLGLQFNNALHFKALIVRSRWNKHKWLGFLFSFQADRILNSVTRSKSREHNKKSKITTHLFSVDSGKHCWRCPRFPHRTFFGN